MILNIQNPLLRLSNIFGESYGNKEEKNSKVKEKGKEERKEKEKVGL
ncbi:MAG: hypothetical protein V1818_03855 [Candidatus Aenigmatarchaeota archaeon]